VFGDLGHHGGGPGTGLISQLFPWAQKTERFGFFFHPFGPGRPLHSLGESPSGGPNWAILSLNPFFYGAGVPPGGASNFPGGGSPFLAPPFPRQRGSGGRKPLPPGVFFPRSTGVFQGPFLPPCVVTRGGHPLGGGAGGFSPPLWGGFDAPWAGGRCLSPPSSGGNDQPGGEKHPSGGAPLFGGAS